MKFILLALLASSLTISRAHGHSWKASDDPREREALRAHLLEEWTAKQQEGVARSGEIKAVQTAAVSGPTVVLAAVAAAANAASAPAAAKAFMAFPKLELKWDKDYLQVGSNGWPDHGMMVGITVWQQQVPLPQAYFGGNAWRIPLNPVPAKTPAMIEGRFLRGAIALAVNGIPIFNPQNNRGEVSFEIGELDHWGGHCGRADDYHYHAAPLHLQAVVGKGLPIAYALDGYAIYGLTEPDGSALRTLDECHGHEDEKWGYHYHASTKRPYVQGGFHGEVVEAEGQVSPQPHAQPVRPDTEPLRGAEITAFESTGAGGYKLSYKVKGSQGSVSYVISTDGTYAFNYEDGRGGKAKQVYAVRVDRADRGPPTSRKDRGKGRGEPDQQPVAGALPSARESQPIKRAQVPVTGSADANGDSVVTAQEFAEDAKKEFAAKKQAGSLADAMAKARTAFLAADANRDGKLSGDELAQNVVTTPSTTGFVLTSPEVEDGGPLPVDYTGDGSGATLPLQWQGAPAGTKSYAVIMDHVAPDGEMKSYWTLWDIPANVTKLAKNSKGVGKVGAGFKGEVGYEPPHSKGPGAKTYVLHVYALSTPPKLTQSAAAVNREMLLEAMQGAVLASADLKVVYSRGGNADGEAGDATPAISKEAQKKPLTQGEQRKPWMQMHGRELDEDHDAFVTLAEMSADMDRGRTLYDTNKDGVITPAEIDAAGDIREGAAFAGMIYRHAVDLDVDKNSRLGDEELAAVVKYFFASADLDHDGRLSAAEIEAAPNAPLPIPNGTGAAAAGGERVEVKAERPKGAPGRKGGGKGGAQIGLIKPSLTDTMKMNVYADNWFMLYINGRLVAVDPIQFTPHNVVSVDFLPEYPMTIAVVAKDNADPMTGMEYGTNIGDGGFVLKFGDGTVTNGTWKAKSFFHGPLNGDTARPLVKQDALPEKWWAVDFDDSSWKTAKEYSTEEVDPKQPYFDSDFAGAKFIWSDDLALDNTVIFRTRIEKPERWAQRWNTKPDLDVSGAPLK